MVLLQVLGGINTDADLRSGRDQGDVGVLDLVKDVATLGGLLNRGALELRQILTGQSEDARSVLGGQGHVVGSAGLVAIGRTPDHVVGEGAQMSESLDRLVSRTVLTKSDRVVGSDPDGADSGEGGQADGTSGVGNKVQEGTAVRNDGTVRSKAVHDSAHAVLTDTITNVTTRVVSEAVGLGLEVNSLLPASQVGASQIGGATEQLGQDRLDLRKDSLRQLAGSHS